MKEEAPHVVAQEGIFKDALNIVTESKPNAGTGATFAAMLITPSRIRSELIIANRLSDSLRFL